MKSVLHILEKMEPVISQVLLIDQRVTTLEKQKVPDCGDCGMDSRVVKLETRNRVLAWCLGVGITVAGLVVKFV
ncbi:hypothetical protein ACFL6N_06125 [Thermodesulfobacteriota bacterium]